MNKPRTLVFTEDSLMVSEALRAVWVQIAFWCRFSGVCLAVVGGLTLLSTFLFVWGGRLEVGGGSRLAAVLVFIFPAYYGFRAGSLISRALAEDDFEILSEGFGWLRRKFAFLGMAFLFYLLVIVLIGFGIRGKLIPGI